MLEDKLRFIEAFYNTAAKPFEKVIQQIENRTGRYRNDPPNFDPEWGEPAYLEELMDAHTSLNLLGQSCLCILQNAFRDFLDGCVVHTRVQKPNLKGNWFKKYKVFFKQRYKIDWDEAPVNHELLEDVSLTRNSIQHTDGHVSWTLNRKQTKDHFSRFPNSKFVSKMDKHLTPSLPGNVTVKKEVFFEALKTVREFCSYLWNHEAAN